MIFKDGWQFNIKLKKDEKASDEAAQDNPLDGLFILNNNTFHRIDSRGFDYTCYEMSLMGANIMTTKQVKNLTDIDGRNIDYLRDGRTS